MPVELRLLHHALAVGQHRNFARAAVALGLAQPSVSRSVAALEKALGVQLFDRTSKGVVPTTFGGVLMELGASVMQREADLRQTIRALAGLDDGTLTVSAGPYRADLTVATAVGRLARAHPRLQVRLVVADPTEVVRDVLAERVEVGVAGLEGLNQEPRLVTERLPDHRFYFACRRGHPLTKEQPLTFAGILKYPLVTTVLRGDVAAVFSSRGARTVAGPRGIHESTPQILVNSVAIGLGIIRECDAVFPATAESLAEDLAAGRLVVLDFDAPVLRPSAFVFHLRDRTLSPAARAFLEILRAVEAEVLAATETTTGPAKRPVSTARRRAHRRQ
jgi:DNA-binding transcriptional LysR family regulator